MTIKNKALYFFTAVAVLIGFMSAGSQPASALSSLGGHDSASRESLLVGVAADLDYTCISDSTDYYYETQGWGTAQLVLPPGLSYDSGTHHISGTPTEAGLYSLPGMWCDVYDSATNHIQSTNLMNAGSIEVLEPIAPPPPSVAGAQIWLEPLNNADCEYSMTLSFPMGSDENSVVVQFGNEIGTKTLHGLDLNSVSHWRVNPDSPEALATEFPEDWRYADEKAGGNFIACGDHLMVTVDYTLNGVQASTSTATVQPFRMDSDLSSHLYIEDSKCTIELDFKLQHEPLDFQNLIAPLTFYVVAPERNASLAFSLEEMELGDWGEIYVNLTDKSISSAYVNGHSINPWNIAVESTGTFTCGDFIPTQMFAKISPLGDPYMLDDSFPDALLPCGKGTFSAQDLGFQDYDLCEDAPVGSYVDSLGAIAATPCPAGMTTLEAGSASKNDCFYPAAICGKGTYSPSGHDLADAPCIDAPIGSYVSIKGAMQATECAVGMTTEEPGAASQYDCFKPTTPTITKLKTPKIAKFGIALTLQGKTDQGTNLTMTASGACTVVPVPSGLTQNYKVTMAKKAGTCKLSVFAKQHGRYTSLTKSISIKVSKTGK